MGYSRKISDRVARIATLLPLSFFGPALNFVISEHLGYASFDYITAGVIAIPLFAALYEASFLLRGRHFIMYSPLFLALFFIFLTWFAGFFLELSFAEPMSNFDKNRPFFFVLGPVSCGLIGLLVAPFRQVFLSKFLASIAMLSFILAVLYISLYNPEEASARVGGGAGLRVGLLLTQGFSSLLALYLLSENKSLTYFAPLPIILMAIVMTGTRSTLVAIGFSLVCFFLIVIIRALDRRTFLHMMIFLCVLLLSITAVIFYAPTESLERITLFEFQGGDDRFMLLHTGFEIFKNFPFGKTTGFFELFGDNIEYVHNSVIQIILEIGIIGAFFFLLLTFFAVIGVVESSHEKDSLAFILYFFPVVITSFSAGDAYFQELWFSSSLIAAYGYSRFARRTSRLAGEKVGHDSSC